MKGIHKLTQKLINSLFELEQAASERFWTVEDRSAWKDELLRFAETKKAAQLKPYLREWTAKSTSKTALAEVTLLDDELVRIFGHQENLLAADTDNEDAADGNNPTSNGQISGVFLGPGFWLNDHWHSTEQRLRSQLEFSCQQGHLVFRNGFFNSAADILMAAELGFTGIQIHAHTLDLFQLQMAIELARDCRLCPIVSAATPEELELAVQTDAPHLGLCYFPEQSNHEQSAFVQQAITQIPKDCTRILFAAIKNASELNYLSQLPFDCIFHFGALPV